MRFLKELHYLTLSSKGYPVPAGLMTLLSVVLIQ